MLTTPKAGSTSSSARSSRRRTSGSDACSGSRRRVTITRGMSPAGTAPAAAGALDPGQGGGQGGAVDHAPAEVVVEAGAAQVLGRLEQQGPQLGLSTDAGYFSRTAATTPAATGQAAEVP